MLPPFEKVSTFPNLQPTTEHYLVVNIDSVHTLFTFSPKTIYSSANTKCPFDILTKIAQPQAKESQAAWMSIIITKSP